MRKRQLKREKKKKRILKDDYWSYLYQRHSSYAYEEKFQMLIIYPASFMRTKISNDSAAIQSFKALTNFFTTESSTKLITMYLTVMPIMGHIFSQLPRI